MSEEEHDHIVPLKYTIRTYLTLLVLTGATIGFAMFDFSILNEYLPRNMDLFPLNIVVALAIATLKAAFVLGFFMAIAYDKHLNKAIVLMNFVFVTVLFGLTLSDTMFRSVADPMEGKKIPFDSPVINANKNPATIHSATEETDAHEEEEEFVEEKSEVVMDVDSSKLGIGDSTARTDTTAVVD